MKTMRILTSLLLGGILLTLGGCEKQDTVTLGARISRQGAGDKLYIDDSRMPQWEAGDPVWINDCGDYEISFSGTAARITGVARDENNSYLALFPASVVPNGTTASGTSVSVVLPREQHYITNGSGQQKVDVPMIALNDGTDLTFRNLCSLLKVTVTNDTGNAIQINRIQLAASAQCLSGAATATLSSGEGSISMAPTGEHDVSLVFDTPISIENNNDASFYIVLPPFATNEVAILVFTNDGKYFPILKTSVGIVQNTITPVSVAIGANQLKTITEGFAVSSSQNVRVAPGNLQYTTVGTHTVADGMKNGTWRFAPHQYDYIGAANSNISSSYTGWIDLFGWGNSGCTAGTAPYSTSGYSTRNGMAGTNYDYGVYNAIEGGGDAPDLWRTPTQAEWNYLFKTRTGCTINDNSNRRWAAVQVNGVKGLLLFPDGYNWPLSGIVSPTTFNQRETNWNSLNYNLAQWAILEAGGCAFLPAAGRRDAGSVSLVSGTVGLQGDYWSATSFRSGSDNIVYSVEFKSNSFLIDAQDFPNYGHSVRLVQNIATGK